MSGKLYSSVAAALGQALSDPKAKVLILTQAVDHCADILTQHLLHNGICAYRENDTWRLLNGASIEIRASTKKTAQPKVAGLEFMLFPRVAQHFINDGKVRWPIPPAQGFSFGTRIYDALFDN